MIKGIICGQLLNVETNTLVADTIDHLTAQFCFRTAEWDEMTRKWAHFSCGENLYDVELIDDGISKDRHLNLSEGEWTVWIHGVREEDGAVAERITTNEVRFIVVGTGTTETGSPFPGTEPSVLEEMKAEIGSLAQLETEDKHTLVDAINEVFRSGNEISPENIAEAVEDYLDKNPVEAVADHSQLTGRELENQHPIQAVAGLQTALDSKQPTGDYAMRSEIPGVEGFASEEFVRQYSQPAGKYLTEETDPTVPEWAKQPQPPVYSADEVNADPKGTAAGVAAEHNVSTDAHNDIRILITDLTRRFNALADSDDIDLDQLSEIIAYIQDNRELIDTVTTSKINYVDIVDNLTTNVSGKPLSAAQGVMLKGLIDAITVPAKLSELTDDSTHRTVTDAEKTAWNSKSDFSGSYNDLSNKPAIPTAVSALTNDTGYVAVSKRTFANGAAVDIPAGNSEWSAEALISALTVTYPSGDFEAWLKFTTAASGDINISIPLDSYIGVMPEFGNGETWEISIKNGVVIAGKIEVNS